MMEVLPVQITYSYHDKKRFACCLCSINCQASIIHSSQLSLDGMNGESSLSDQRRDSKI